VNVKIEKIKSEFGTLSDWEARYQLVIAKGRALVPMSDDLKTDDNKVKGCQSQVWLSAQLSPQGLVQFSGDSDALIVKGLLALVLQVYNQETPENILNTKPDFIREIGFEQNLSPSRANGLLAMIRQIQYYATAFAILQRTKR
jgi:cysteine desulfuration protein SufE